MASPSVPVEEPMETNSPAGIFSFPSQINSGPRHGFLDYSNTVTNKLNYGKHPTEFSCDSTATQITARQRFLRVMPQRQRLKLERYLLNAECDLDYSAKELDFHPNCKFALENWTVQDTGDGDATLFFRLHIVGTMDYEWRDYDGMFKLHHLFVELYFREQDTGSVSYLPWEVAVLNMVKSGVKLAVDV